MRAAQPEPMIVDAACVSWRLKTSKLRKYSTMASERGPSGLAAPLGARFCQVKTSLIAALSAAAGMFVGATRMAPALNAHMTAPTNAVLYVRILKDMRAERYSRAMDV